MKQTEELEMSVQSGEFIHTIANRLCDGEIKISGVNQTRQKLIMELSELLRRKGVQDSDAPLLLAEGFHVTQHPRSSWINLAGHLLDAPEDQLVVDIFRKLPDKPVQVDELLDLFDDEPSKSHTSIFEYIALALFVILMFFFFYGEPDVWDSLRTYFTNL
ncbi:hypothetical protein OH460_08295 [Vibrio sp. Makdt]|uniref:hypothetical protein n=1 Tax=Vibrio sp. Makdt TaxID=2998828 RepID=UPI0022CDB5FE|nr:hypothetical protein [Vibrio sp. Makdt]MDA0152299.1 hypothetical protein [Vibrio sp. Makdt]